VKKWSGKTGFAFKHESKYCEKSRRHLFAVRQMLVAVHKDQFQCAKAVSLVSSNRNCSVGDSTWPSQKTTLALLDDFEGLHNHPCGMNYVG
jgi:hypothetical protein